MDITQTMSTMEKISSCRLGLSSLEWAQHLLLARQGTGKDGIDEWEEVKYFLLLLSVLLLMSR